MSRPRNSAFRYIEDVPASDLQITNIERILYTPIEDLSDLNEFVDDESDDDITVRFFKNNEDGGLQK
jgi:hypothetical protein